MMTKAQLHRGEHASYSCDEGTLQLHAGLGVSPAEVYVPPREKFLATAPEWARALYDDVVKSFTELGARVVVSRSASVWE
jgi:hypothetical protein